MVACTSAAQAVDPRIDEWREQPAVEGDAHDDAREEREDKLDPAHRATVALTAPMCGGTGESVWIRPGD